MHSSDKYGDNGLISVIILIGFEDGIRIDTFLMSCRVMGRKVEDVIINELTARYRKNFFGEFIPTAKNTPVKELYDKLGFSLVSNSDGHKIYKLDALDYIKKDFGIYKDVRFED